MCRDFYFLLAAFKTAHFLGMYRNVINCSFVGGFRMENSYLT